MIGSQKSKTMVIVITGLPGVGKTTLANSLAPLIEAQVLSSDKIRKELFARPTYSKHEKLLVYDVMGLVAKYLNRSGKNCIVDATFNREEFRKRFKERLDLQDDSFKIVECRCQEETVLSRLAKRKDKYSDADIEVYQMMKKMYEPIKMSHIEIDTSKDPKENARYLALAIGK